MFSYLTNDKWFFEICDLQDVPSICWPTQKWQILSNMFKKPFISWQFLQKSVFVEKLQNKFERFNIWRTSAYIFLNYISQECFIFWTLRKYFVILYKAIVRNRGQIEMVESPKSSNLAMSHTSGYQSGWKWLPKSPKKFQCLTLQPSPAALHRSLTHSPISRWHHAKKKAEACYKFALLAPKVHTASS